MSNDAIKKVYDEFGYSYYSREHKTIGYFNMIQAFTIRIAFSEQASFLKKKLEEVDVLNIGVGNGQHCEQLCLPIYKHAMGERVRWDRITDFDISSVMLEAAKRYYPNKKWQKENKEGEPKQIQGDVLYLSDYVSSESFDIVLAGLCDHIQDQETMYNEILKVLKPKGILITSYPHKDLMTNIRKDIYQIDPSFTRYDIRGKMYLVPSLTVYPKDITDLFVKTGFEVVKSENLYHNINFDLHNDSLSDTVKKAQKIQNKKLEDIPILVFGVGRKPVKN